MEQNFVRLKVYFNNLLAGYLSQITNGNSTNYIFKYETSYFISKQTSPLSFNLPKKQEYFESYSKLPPFFDNLVSEGWLREKQIEALKTKSKKNDKFEILSFFGHDLIGSVSIEREVSTEESCIMPQFLYRLNSESESTISIRSNATIPGIQKKILIKEETTQGEGEKNDYVITKPNELSTHIAKLKATEFPFLIELEYLSTHAMKYLLPNDEINNVEIKYLNELKENALIIQRFDRYLTLSNIVKRKHFEEFNQLLNKQSNDKYDFSYDQMALFIRQNESCKKGDIVKLFKRVLACILIGNTDAHLKNFAMFHNEDGSLSLTPMYDIVAASYYDDFYSFALKINRNSNVNINKMKAKTIVDFALNSNGFNLEETTLIQIINEFEINKNKAVEFLQLQSLNETVQNKLIDIIKKKWNGIFSGVGACLRKRKRQIN